MNISNKYSIVHISNTYYEDLIDTGLKLFKEQMEDHNVLFQKDDKEVYIKKC